MSGKPNTQPAFLKCDIVQLFKQYIAFIFTFNEQIYTCASVEH